MISNYTTIPYDTYLNNIQIRILDNPHEENKLTRAYKYIKEHPGKGFGTLVPCEKTIDNIEMYLYVEGLSASYLWLPVCWIAKLAQITPSVACIFGSAAIAGLVIFESIVIVKNINSIQESAHYLTWKRQHFALLENNSLIDFINKDDICAYLFCPISKKIPEMPARVDNNDLTYDYFAAEEWILNNPNEPLPGDHTLRKIEDFKFDYSNINTLIVRLNHLGYILKGEKMRRICRIIDVNLMSEELTTFIFVIDYCSLAGFATLGELFGSKCREIKKSFDQLDRFIFTVSNFNLIQRTARFTEFKKEYKELRELPFKTEQQQNYYDKQLIDFSGRSSSIKRIEIESKSDSKIAEFIYKHLGDSIAFEVFGIKRSFRVTRSIEIDLVNSKEWGFAQIYDGESELLEKNSNCIVKNLHIDKFSNVVSPDLNREAIKLKGEILSDSDEYSEIISESDSETSD